MARSSAPPFLAFLFTLAALFAARGDAREGGQGAEADSGSPQSRACRRKKSCVELAARLLARPEKTNKNECLLFVLLRARMLAKKGACVMAFTVRVVKYEPWAGDPSALVTLAEARIITGLTLPGLIAAIHRGELTEIIDDSAKYQGRRKLLKAEVEAYSQKQTSKTE